MENKRNYYRLLHVQFDAPAPVIKSSYRTMMQKMRLHPDLGGDESNAQLLNVALATLLDPVKRADYDRWLKKHQPESLKPTKRTGQVKPQTAEQSVNSNGATSSAVDTVLCCFCQVENHRSKTLNPHWGKQSSNHCRRCKAPLKMVDSVVATESGELRRIHRNILSTSCVVQVSADAVDTILAEVVDFSVLGLSINYSGTLNKGQCVFIRSGKFECVARTSYSINKANGKVISGLEFLTLELTMPKGELFKASY